VKCDLCPRKCLVDRKKGEKGICGQTENLKVARAALHFWEEPCLSDKQGYLTYIRYEKKFYEKFSCWLNLCLEYKVELCLSYDGFVRNL